MANINDTKGTTDIAEKKLNEVAWSDTLSLANPFDVIIITFKYLTIRARKMLSSDISRCQISVIRNFNTL
ncbi:MAG: hypothetical protein A2X17_00340 [Bacteroidetes bacterium GWF2_41_61]|nr:MAG: hypothetical protein A2X20_05685 [Bacteroidetes bacterium GWE2_40_15]OFY27972.1 MAG: hypothetical protein A2X17_00340 [Bacteroidetes bacterium GWF2_41_61]OFY90585.1 MAG: hypothetical protein A2266_10190 [Bacteroidetes bacterium RIFOXYA12_FULL_40_10]